MRTTPILLAGAAAAALLLTACSGSADSTESSAAPSTASVAPTDTAPTETAPTDTPAPAPSSPAANDQVKPQAEGMAVDAFADAVLDQLKFAGPGTLSDQLVTIAMSPLTRQMASSADIDTRLDSKGARVIFTLSGTDATCKVTVTDAPAARGVTCAS